jgi:Asp/Glu/hydantoin racemase
MLAAGGQTNYKQDIGILMLDTIFPRIVGDIGNAETFSFPIRYKVIKHALPTKIVVENDQHLLADFIAGAKELEAAGVRAITTSCGFLAIFQQELAAAVSIPVFTSSLLQVPLAQKMLAPRREIVIVTANKARLSPRHLAQAGVAGGKVAIFGLEDKVEFYSTFVLQKPVLDLAKLSREMEEAAGEIKTAYPDAGALILECTNLPPFRRIFQQATQVPVFDVVTLVEYIHASLNKIEPGQ